MSKNACRIVELDTFRAVGAMSVVAVHLYPAEAFWAASFAWMFFTLSGFLITRMLLSAEGPPGTALRNFWIRRVLRVWPVYYVTFLGLLLYTAASLRYARLPDGSFEGAFQAAVFLQFFEYHWVPPPTLFAENFVTFFPHSWTLAVEEQFYVVWPLLVLPLMRRPVALGLLCGAAILLPIYARYSGLPAFVLMGVLDAFAVGGLIAVLERAGLVPDWQTRPLPRWMKPLLAFVLLAALPFFCRWLYLGWVYPDDYRTMLGLVDNIFLGTAFAAAYGCAILIVVHLSGHPSLAFLRVPAVVYIGTTSYSLYMYHYPIIQLYLVAISLLGVSRNWVVDLLIWVTVVAAGSVSYSLIERPLNRLKRHFLL